MTHKSHNIKLLQQIRYIKQRRIKHDNSVTARITKIRRNFRVNKTIKLSYHKRGALQKPKQFKSHRRQRPHYLRALSFYYPRSLLKIRTTNFKNTVPKFTRSKRHFQQFEHYYERRRRRHKAINSFNVTRKLVRGSLPRKISHNYLGYLDRKIKRNFRRRLHHVTIGCSTAYQSRLYNKIRYIFRKYQNPFFG